MQITEFIFSGKRLLPFRDLFGATEELKRHAAESSGKCELLGNRHGMSKIFGGAGTQFPEEKENHSQSYPDEPFMSTSPAGRRWCWGPLVYPTTDRLARATARCVPLFQARSFYMLLLPFTSAGV